MRTVFCIKILNYSSAVAEVLLLLHSQKVMELAEKEEVF